MIKSQKVRLYPNRHMKENLDKLCDYRRFCWNHGLAIWNDMYDLYTIDSTSPRPSAYAVRNELVANKADWQYNLSARTLQLAIADLGKAWKNFLTKAKPDWGKPTFKSKRAPRQGFKTDRAKVVNGKLRLDRPCGAKYWYDIRISKNIDLFGTLRITNIYREDDKYWANFFFDVNLKSKIKTGNNSAVDVNVGHFNYTNGIIRTLPKQLDDLYQQIRFYQKKLAHKRIVNGRKATKSNSYRAMKIKLRNNYHKVAYIQHDLVHKFTTKLVTDYDKIVIEDLSVKDMKMSHVASKGLHRSMFGYFRQLLSYKCRWYGKELILADKYYPSTQRCSKCQHIKTGNDKLTLQGNTNHKTRHNEYVCYNCGLVLDRDKNAVANLLDLI
ncbi:RNA-guided endonuclease InsQ/TnpB family protein [Companilactobacillus nantensis]|nr:RNA-guided endonuclease TnpB family protein [Companilactobacillus nantensis]GEO65449.1 transposase [Companilactobacillus nantensis]